MEERWQEIIMTKTLVEVSSIINNILVSSITIYQRGGEQRKKLLEFFVEFGLYLDELNKDVLRIINNIFKMSKEDILKEIAK